jgi:hypothetical protein
VNTASETSSAAVSSLLPQIGHASIDSTEEHVKRGSAYAGLAASSRGVLVFGGETNPTSRADVEDGETTGPCDGRRRRTSSSRSKITRLAGSNLRVSITSLSGQATFYSRGMVSFAVVVNTLRPNAYTGCASRSFVCAFILTNATGIAGCDGALTRVCRRSSFIVPTLPLTRHQRLLIRRLRCRI